MLALNLHTPVEPFASAIAAQHGVEIWLKRDDLIHPFISGNKWRKLQYVLADAKAMQRNNLVSFGGAYSNHLLALACAGASEGFKTTAFVRGDEVNNHLLGLCKLYGMQLRFTDREAYRDKQALFDAFYGDDDSAYFIDEGGKGSLAIKGCVSILEDVEGFTHVCCAAGTGTTLAGLAIGAAGKGMQAEGFCVLKGAEAMNQELAVLLHGNNNWTLHHRFHYGGYAKPNAEVMQFIAQTAATIGVLLDHVYTAKMMLGILTLIEEEHYPPGSKILAVHTGGLLGLLSQV